MLVPENKLWWGAIEGFLKLRCFYFDSSLVTELLLLACDTSTKTSTLLVPLSVSAHPSLLWSRTFLLSLC